MREATRTRRWLVAVGTLLLAAALLVAVVSVRIYVEGHRELRTAEALAASGQLEQAAVHAGRAASWYLPGSPHVPAAYARLIAIARVAESRGDLDTALFAWRTLRGAAWSSRSWVMPHREELAAADVSIARLASQKPAAWGSGRFNAADREAQLHDQLILRNYPRPGWVAVLVASFLVIVLGVGHTARTGFSDAGALQWSRARAGVLIMLVGIAGWAVSLWYA